MSLRTMFVTFVFDPPLPFQGVKGGWCWRTAAKKEEDRGDCGKRKPQVSLKNYKSPQKLGSLRETCSSPAGRGGKSKPKDLGKKKKPLRQGRWLLGEKYLLRLPTKNWQRHLHPYPGRGLARDLQPNAGRSVSELGDSEKTSSLCGAEEDDEVFCNARKMTRKIVRRLRPKQKHWKNKCFQTAHAKNMQLFRGFLQFLVCPQDIGKLQVHLYVQVFLCIHDLCLSQAKTLKNKCFQTAHAKNMQFFRSFLQFLVCPQDIGKLQVHLHVQVFLCIHDLCLFQAKTLKNTCFQTAHAKNMQFCRSFLQFLVCPQCASACACVKLTFTLQKKFIQSIGPTGDKVDVQSGVVGGAV